MIDQTAGYSRPRVVMPAGGDGPRRAARLDLAIVRQQISNLLLQNPELAEDEILRADTIEGETDAFDLLRQIEAKRREAVRQITGIVDDVGELTARLERFKRREQSLRRLAFTLMDYASMRRVELPEATYSIANGQRKVIITDENILPHDYCKVTYTPSKTAIKAALEAGITVSGAELSNAEPHLTIRTK